MAILGFIVLVIAAILITGVLLIFITYGGEDFSPADLIPSLAAVIVIYAIWKFVVDISPFTVTIN